MKKVLTSVLFVTIVLCLFSCSDAIPSNNSENDSYFAVRVGTTDGDYSIPGLAAVLVVI